MKKNFLAGLLLIIFIFLVLYGVKKNCPDSTRGISSYICIACMGFR